MESAVIQYSDAPIMRIDFLKETETLGPSAMATIEQHLRALELEHDTTHEAIKESYRRLVKVWHPDRFLHDADLRTFAENRCKQINLAYEFLLSLPPEKLKKPDKPTEEETESMPPPIQVSDVQYRNTVVAQIVTKPPQMIADRQWMESFNRIGRNWNIEFRIGNAKLTETGPQLGMVFDSAKRIVSFPSPELIQIDFPMFAAATICMRDFTFKSDFSGNVGKGFQFAGWDGVALPPSRNYFEAEHKLTKITAELDIERVRNRDNDVTKDLKAWFRPKNLMDCARWVTNRVRFARG